MNPALIRYSDEDESCAGAVTAEPINSIRDVISNVSRCLIIAFTRLETER